MYDARRRARKPRWFSLYVIATSLLGVLGLVETGMAPGLARQVVDVTVTIMLFGAMALWVRVNRVAMMATDQPTTSAIPTPPPAIPDEAPVPTMAPFATSPALHAYLVAVSGSRTNLRSLRGGRV